MSVWPNNYMYKAIKILLSGQDLINGVFLAAVAFASLRLPNPLSNNAWRYYLTMAVLVAVAIFLAHAGDLAWTNRDNNQISRRTRMVGLSAAALTIAMWIVIARLVNLAQYPRACQLVVVTNGLTAALAILFWLRQNVTEDADAMNVAVGAV